MFNKILFLSLICLSLVTSIHAQETGTLIVRVIGLKSSKGFVRYGLFNSKETFPKENKVFRKGKHPIKNDKCEFELEGLEFGEYALAVGHDKNDNGKIDRILGLPMEPVGVSGYSKRLWSFPKFQKAKFLIGEKTQLIVVSVF